MKRIKIFGLCSMIFFFCAVVMAQAEKIIPEQKVPAQQIIHLNTIAGLDPKAVTVKAGTTVIWVNESGSVAEIQFIDKQVTLACKGPTHFIIDDDGTFISDKITSGAVASLCFIQKGTFKYVVLRDARRTAPVKAPPELLEGTIIVE